MSLILRRVIKQAVKKYLQKHEAFEVFFLFYRLLLIPLKINSSKRTHFPGKGRNFFI